MTRWGRSSSFSTRPGRSSLSGIGTVPTPPSSKTRSDLPEFTVKVDPKWRARGACRDYPLPKFEHYWFPETAEVDPRAKAICAACPVQERCAEYGKQNEDEGVWGGTSKAEQRVIATRRRREEARKNNVHPVVMAKCASPTCDVVFDTMLTMDGQPASRKRFFCSRECKLSNRRRKERSKVTCKCGCGEVFMPYSTYDGRPHSKQPRQFYSRACFSRYKSAIQTRRDRPNDS